MSIELNSPAGPSKAPVSGGGNHVKGKSNAAGQADATDAGGFLSLLMALGDDARTGGLPAAQDASLVPQDAAGNPLLPPDGAPGTPPDPAALLAQSLQLSSPSKMVNGDLAQVQTQATGSAPATPVSASKALAERDLRSDITKSLTRANDFQPESTQLSIQQMQEQEQEMAKASLPNKPAPATGAAALALQTGAANPASDPRFLKPSFDEGLTGVNPALPAVLATAEAGEAGIRPLERQAEKFAVRQVGGGEGAWGHQALLAGARVETAAAGAATVSPEMMVAEQVKYWISNNVQNAEMTLDGMGKSPVEVSISLHGAEARVEFRTDQMEVRQVLEGAVSHLKDLLRNEGMVLSGVSVGSSGQDGRQGSQERKPRPHNMRQAAVVAAEPLPVNGGLRTGRLSGRAIDLFV